MTILVLNAGSSSLKFSVFDGDSAEAAASGLIDWKEPSQPATVTFRSGTAEPVRAQVSLQGYSAAVRHALHLLTQSGIAAGAIKAVGHRVVHGGTAFRSSVRIDAKVKQAIRGLFELAPLHNPPALEGIEGAEAALPNLPQVAVFDTAFHAHLPPSAFVWAVPYEWYTDWGIRRFGFHGISFAYCTGRAAEMLGRPAADLRLVICHLGNGCSASAVRGGVSVATTMGFTPLDGLMMGTRCGWIDPSAVLYVQRRHGIGAEDMENILSHRSGLLGVSGVSSDYREVQAAADAGNERARLALQIYTERVRAAVGALTVTLGGLDALVFTAGVGENSAGLRAAVCSGLECLGLKLDEQRNEKGRPDMDISAASSSGRILVLHTREDLLIAREARRIIGTDERGG